MIVQLMMTGRMMISPSGQPRPCHHSQERSQTGWILSTQDVSRILKNHTLNPGYILIHRSIHHPTYFLQWPVQPACSNTVVSFMRRHVVNTVMAPGYDHVQVLHSGVFGQFWENIETVFWTVSYVLSVFSCRLVSLSVCHLSVKFTLLCLHTNVYHVYHLVWLN